MSATLYLVKTNHERWSGHVPSLDPRTVSTLTGLVQQCVAREVGQSGSLVPFPAFSANDGAEFLRAAHRHRVVSLIARHAKPAAADDLWRKLQEHARFAAIRSSENLRETQVIHELLTTSHIPHTFIKGPGLSLLITGRLGLKDFGSDVDFLVPLEWAEATHAALSAEGFAPNNGATPENAKAWASMLLAYRELTYSRRGMTVELHWRLSDAPSTFEQPEAMIDRAVTVSYSGYHLPLLGPHDALDLECYKLLDDRSFSLSQVVSISLLAQKFPEALSLKRPPTLGKIVQEALMFSADVTGLDSGRPPHNARRGSRKLAKFLKKNWDDFSLFGLRYPSRRIWRFLPPIGEIVDRYRIMRFSGGFLEALTVLSLRFIRPYKSSFSEEGWRVRSAAKQG
jgi:hypothetical protein